MPTFADRLRKQISRTSQQWLKPQAALAAARRLFARALRQGDVPARPGAARATPAGQARPTRARFESGTFACRDGTRDYKLFIPDAASGARTLIVMLHGCGQDADDFARGTHMNELASQHAALVLYPQQSNAANQNGCWNWFKPGDQRHGAGEPAIIAGLTGQIINSYGIDPARVFIGGLSAGGAMAAIMVGAYPQLFRACAIHSGLPHGAADDLAGALAAMRAGARPARSAADDAHGAVPVIVFHGDRDATVSPRNGAAVIELALARAGRTRSAAEIEHGARPGGHRYTRRIYRHRDGAALAEHWIIHGGTHAWSGGRAGASHTDEKGPDASTEILRFFHQQIGRNL